jgi:hypothetical protein
MIRTVRFVADQLTTWPDCDAKHVRSGAAQTPTQAAPRHAAARPHPARISGREIQALWPAGVSLRRRTRSWTKGLSVGQRVRTATADGLCAERQRRRGARAGRQLQHGTRHLERSLRDQHGASASPRGVGLNGPDHRGVRFRQGGRHHRQHGRLLSCRQRVADARSTKRPAARRATGALPARIATGALPARRQGGNR